MKKLIALCTIALAAVAFTGCGKSASDVKLTPAPQVAEAKVNDATKALTEAYKEVVAAYANKDAAKITTATTKVSDAITKISTSMEGLKDDEQKKITDWMTTVSNEYTAEITKAAK